MFLVLYPNIWLRFLCSLDCSVSPFFFFLIRGKLAKSLNSAYSYSWLGQIFYFSSWVLSEEFEILIPQWFQIASHSCFPSTSSIWGETASEFDLEFPSWSHYNIWECCIIENVFFITKWVQVPVFSEISFHLISAWMIVTDQSSFGVFYWLKRLDFGFPEGKSRVPPHFPKRDPWICIHEVSCI